MNAKEVMQRMAMVERLIDGASSPNVPLDGTELRDVLKKIAHVADGGTFYDYDEAKWIVEESEARRVPLKKIDTDIPNAFFPNESEVT